MLTASTDSDMIVNSANSRVMFRPAGLRSKISIHSCPTAISGTIRLPATLIRHSPEEAMMLCAVAAASPGTISLSVTKPSENPPNRMTSR